MIKKEKRKFILNKGNIEYIINKYFKNHFREYDFNVRQSNWSQSIYVDVKNSDTSEYIGKIRISDHESISHCKNNLVVERSKYSKIIGIIRSDLNRFRRRSFRKLYAQIGDKKR